MSYSTNTEHHHHRFETEEMNHLYKKRENAVIFACIIRETQLASLK